MEGSSPDAVLDLVLRARRRLRLSALADGFAAPGAFFLLIAAAILALARLSGRADVPAGFLVAAGAMAAAVGCARTLRAWSGTAGAALHLDRTLGAAERFSTVLETEEEDPELAVWAARGAMARARDPGAVETALALRMPAAVVPLLLAAALAAGLALLPPAAAPASAGEDGGTETAVADGPAGTPGAGTARAPSALPDARAAAAAAASRRIAAAPAAQAGEVIAGLEERERSSPSPSAAARAALAEAREAVARGDRGGAAAAVGRAVEALYGAPVPAPSPGVPGTDGGGEAAAGEDSPRAAPGFAPAAVPLRARDAVRRYFRSGE